MTMPKACISCVHYQNLGWKHDQHCPFKADFASSPAKTRTPFGHCDLHRSNVFATEICNSHHTEPFVKTTAVQNRPEPMTPIQERLALSNGDSHDLPN
ncbi:MAG: hypothetical protein R3180_00045 [Marinobacter sp.]|nr:hypothetical protein [Marinobacter sp.]